MRKVLHTLTSDVLSGELSCFQVRLVTPSNPLARILSIQVHWRPGPAERNYPISHIQKFTVI